MARTDIYDISIKDNESGRRYISRESVKSGQKVRITRMVTIEYDVVVADILDDTDESEINLETLIGDDVDNTDYRSIDNIWDNHDVLDDVVISVEIL